MPQTAHTAALAPLYPDELAERLGPRRADDYQRMAGSIFTHTGIHTVEGPIRSHTVKGIIARELGLLLSSLGVVAATEPTIRYATPETDKVMNQVVKRTAAATTLAERVAWVTSALVHARQDYERREAERLSLPLQGEPNLI